MDLRKLVATVLALVVLGGVVLYALHESQAREPLRVISFNVLGGFRDGVSRHDRAVAWVAGQQPDIVALQELNDYTDEKLKEDARLWGHEHTVLLPVPSGFHLGLTSREPIDKVRTSTEQGIWHGVLQARTFGLDVTVVHLAPQLEDVRMPETTLVLEQLASWNPEKRQGILLGDFNSPARSDASYYQDNGLDWPFNVMDRYLAAGWVDVVAYHQGVMNRNTISIPTQLVEAPGISGRIDYILATDELAAKCTSARVANEEDTHLLSDHYPVVAEFDWQ